VDAFGGAGVGGPTALPLGAGVAGVAAAAAGEAAVVAVVAGGEAAGRAAAAPAGDGVRPTATCALWRDEEALIANVEHEAGGWRAGRRSCCRRGLGSCGCGDGL